MIAVYIHWPFCVSKCPYCDFNSHVGDTTDQETWRRAYGIELASYADVMKGHDVGSVFFGGGTPSLMDVKTVESVLNDIGRLWRMDENVEITLEANPSSAEAAKFAEFRAAGVNRLSLGIQSFNDSALKFLGRAHDAATARKALELAARHFPRSSFDLIYSYAGHTPKIWEEELREALTLVRGHVSLYQLTIEPQTQFFVRDKKGEVLTATDDDSVQMYELTQRLTEDAGFPAYEISNHAVPGEECRHNMTYWRYGDYIGIGPGAHGRLSSNSLRHAIENHRAPDAWLQQIETKGHGAKVDEILGSAVAMREAVMMGLRTAEGLDYKRWADLFGTSLLSYLPKTAVERMKKEGFVVAGEKNIRATRAGLQRLNAVIDYLLNA